MRNTNEIAPSYTIKRMACGADFTVNLVASSDACMIESIKKAIVRPGICSGMQPVFCRSVCMDFADEWKRAVEVGIPSN
jgi:hypothetical protein